VTDDPTTPKPSAKDERRAHEHGCSGSTAKSAVEGRPRLEDRFIDAPYARPAPPIREGETVDQLAEKKAVVGDAREALIDEAVEETFPASDPPSASRSG
jgi:hypothetical protein